MYRDVGHFSCQNAESSILHSICDKLVLELDNGARTAKIDHFHIRTAIWSYFERDETLIFREICAGPFFKNWL
jgi:hypothetical protein